MTGPTIETKIKSLTNKRIRKQAYDIIDTLDLTDDDLFVLKKLPVSDYQLLEIVKELEEEQNEIDRLNDIDRLKSEKDI